jgi:hypothetical protein
MREARRLTEEGTSRFEAYIESLRQDGSLPPPLELLDDPICSEPIGCNAQLDDKAFTSRYELGQYLVEQFRSCEQRLISNDSGLWNWLALLFFEQICKFEDGRRKPSEVAHYILSKHFGKRPRHAIRTTYILVRRYSEKVRFMFSKLDERGELIEQIAATQYLWACEGVIEAASRLYQDNLKNTFKFGAGGSGGGSARRLKTYLSQLTLTYDLLSLTADEVLTLLPAEYNKFKPSSKGASIPAPPLPATP